MKKESNTKNIISATLCLFVICVVVTFAVAGTRYVFADKIAEQEWLQQQETMSKLIKADRYEEYVKAETDDESPIYQALDASGQVLGYLFITSTYGYGSEVSVMSAISDEGLVGIDILDASSETPGLGQNVMNEKFINQFNALKSVPVLTKSEPESEDQVEAVTGATKTSNAVVQSVEKAFELYETLVKE